MKQTLAQEANEIYQQLDDNLDVPDIHKHSLEKLPSVYGGMYGCDVCDKTGQDAVYHCEECGFDAHPQCAVGKSNFYDLYRKVMYGTDDGDGDDYDDDHSDNDHED